MSVVRGVGGGRREPQGRGSTRLGVSRQHARTNAHIAGAGGGSNLSPQSHPRVCLEETPTRPYEGPKGKCACSWSAGQRRALGSSAPSSQLRPARPAPAPPQVLVCPQLRATAAWLWATWPCCRVQALAVPLSEHQSEVRGPEPHPASPPGEAIVPVTDSDLEPTTPQSHILELGAATSQSSKPQGAAAEREREVPGSPRSFFGTPWLRGRCDRATSEEAWPTGCSECGSWTEEVRAPPESPTSHSLGPHISEREEPGQSP